MHGSTQLNKKERLFCIIAYLPKATVQAAIGSVPLPMGLPCGQLVLSVAVLAILVTAPIGAIGMDKTYRRLLVHGENPGAWRGHSQKRIWARTRRQIFMQHEICLQKATWELEKLKNLFTNEKR